MPRSEVERQEAIDWIRARPKSLHELMVKFPPSCYVKATQELRCPAPGKIGQVISYVEKKNGEPATLRVRELLAGNVGAECEAGWLEVTGYWEDCTPDFVRLALSR